MPQVLYKDKEKIAVDQTFVEGGEPPRYGLVGGQRVLLREGTPPQPTIHRKGTTFFFDDGKFVSEEAQVQHLPPKVREQALEFIRAQGQGLKPKHVTTRASRTPRVGRKKTKVIDFDPVEALGHEALRVTKA